MFNQAQCQVFHTRPSGSPVERCPACGRTDGEMAASGGLAGGAAGSPGTQLIRRKELRYDTAAQNILGKGGFGIVYRGEWNGSPVAIKQIKEPLTEGDERDFRQEIEMMSGLNHPHIIVLYGAVLESRPYCMVIDVMSQSLEKVLMSDEELPWSERYRSGWRRSY